VLEKIGKIWDGFGKRGREGELAVATGDGFRADGVARSGPSLGVSPMNEYFPGPGFRGGGERFSAGAAGQVCAVDVGIAAGDQANALRIEMSEFFTCLSRGKFPVITSEFECLAAETDGEQRGFRQTTPP